MQLRAFSISTSPSSDSSRSKLSLVIVIKAFCYLSNSIWTRNDFQWKGLIKSKSSFKINIYQSPRHVMTQNQIHQFTQLKLMVTILEAWLFSIFCKPPRKILRSITSLKMWSSGVPQADYGTSLKHDSCSEKSPLSLVKSALHTRYLATDACVYMYVYVCVCICMCVYVCGCSDDQCKGSQREPLWLTRSGRVVIVFVFVLQSVLVLRRVCVHRFEGCYW